MVGLVVAPVVDVVALVVAVVELVVAMVELVVAMVEMLVGVVGAEVGTVVTAKNNLIVHFQVTKIITVLIDSEDVSARNPYIGRALNVEDAIRDGAGVQVKEAEVISCIEADTC